MEIKKRIDLISPLSKKEQRELIATGDVALMKQYLGKKTLSLEFSETAQVALVKTGNIELIMAYHRKFKFCQKAQIEVVKSGNIELIKLFGYFTDKAEGELIKTCKDVGFLKTYVSKNILGIEAEMELVRRGDAELMKAYLDRFNNQFKFSVPVQIEIVKSGNLVMLWAYLSDKGFYEDAQSEIVKSGRMDFLKTYMRRHRFYMDTEAELIKTGDIERIKCYFNKYKLRPPAEEELLKLGNEELIDAYEKQWGGETQPLCEIFLSS